MKKLSRRQVIDAAAVLGACVTVGSHLAWSAQADVVARGANPFSWAIRLKYSAAMRLLAEPCRHKKATF